MHAIFEIFERENIGMIYVGNSLKDAISNTARCLHVIHQEISAPNMQGLLEIQPRDIIMCCLIGINF